MRVGDASDGELLEREIALNAINEALGAVGAGRGEVMLLIGAPGIGKTSLMRTAMRAASAAGVRVGSAVGGPMESGLPFGLIGQALVSLGGSDVDDVVELQRLGDPSARMYRIFRWLLGVADESPLLLALDDLHWADPDSLVLLGFLARRVRGARILVIGTLRPEPEAAKAVAQELVGGGQARMLGLEPLSRDGSVALIRRLVEHEVDEAECERLWRACAGTPLLLAEAARMLGAGGALPPTSTAGQFGPSLLLERFAGLDGDGDALAYMQAAATLGVRFRSALAGALAGLDDARIQLAHDRLVRARLIEDLGGGGAGFVHPLFAQALLDAQPLSQRERRHDEAFRLLLDRGESDAMAAEHAVAAGLVGDPDAVDACARAGRAALAQGALEAATAHLGDAVRLAEDAASDHLLLDYASALAARGLVDGVDHACGTLVARSAGNPAVRARALALQARTAMMAGRPSEAERLYESATDAAALADPAVEVAILADAASTFVVAPISWTLAMTSRALAILAPDAPQREPLELLRTYSLVMAGDPSAAATLAQSARLVDRGDDEWGWGPAIQRANACKMLEDFDEAMQLFQSEFDRVVESGAPLLIATLAISYADVLHRIGRPREGLELVQHALTLSDVTLAPWTDLALAALLTELGSDDDAAPHVEALRTFLVTVPPEYYAPVSLWLDALDARRLMGVGEPDRASDAMLHAAHTAELTGWREPCIVPWVGVGIDAHLAAGRLDRARILIADVAELAQPLSCRWPLATLELGRARLATLEGCLADADRKFQRALETFAELPLPIAYAEALLAYGEHLRRSGRPSEARQRLTRALELCERTGAERVTRLARAELAAAGGRRRRHDTDPRELTAQEQRVAAHAAEGMTNAQIAAVLHVSPKTIGHHLEHIYAKLDIHSRRELMRAASSAVDSSDEAFARS